MASRKTPSALAARRRRSLQTLIDEFLVEQVALKGPSAALSNERRFAERIAVKASYLSAIKNGHRAIGEALARQIERACAKPPGWLDERHAAEASPNEGEEQLLVELLMRAYRQAPEAARTAVQDLLASLGDDSSVSAKPRGRKATPRAAAAKKASRRA